MGHDSCLGLLLGIIYKSILRSIYYSESKNWKIQKKIKAKVNPIPTIDPIEMPH